MRAGRTEQRELPHEEGAWITFRTLSGTELDEAGERATQKALALVKGFDPEALRAYQAAASVQSEAPVSAGYDKDTLIRYVVVGCSECDPCSDEAKRMLDAATRDWAVEVITEMNTRPLTSMPTSAPPSDGTKFRETSALPSGS